VETSYGTISYPFAFSDLIGVQAHNLGGATALEFTAKLNNGSYRIFTIWFGAKDGIPLGSLNLDGVQVPVMADIYEKPTNLSENDNNSFFAAQECFNDVVNSLGQIKDFTFA
jgi:hypothetical protein